MEFTKNKSGTAPFVLITDVLTDAQVDAVVATVPANPDKVIIAIDHDTPSGTVAVANKQKKLIQFAKEYQTKFYYGRGIGYHIAMEEILHEGDLLLGLGKHIATVGTMGALGIAVSIEELLGAIATGTYDYAPPEAVCVQLSGQLANRISAYDLALDLIQKNRERIQNKLVVLQDDDGILSLTERTTLCNLLSNAGVYSVLFSDSACGISNTLCVNLKEISAMAVCPGGFEEIVPASRIDGLRVNQVFIGGCMGGDIASMRKVAAAFAGKQVDRYVRVMICPATSKVYEQMIDEELITPILDSGALLMNQGCSACWAKSQGLVDDNEVFVTTGSYNCANWAGKNNNKIYITSTDAAVKCALTGSLYEN